MASFFLFRSFLALAIIDRTVQGILTGVQSLMAAGQTTFETAAHPISCLTYGCTNLVAVPGSLCLPDCGPIGAWLFEYSSPILSNITTLTC